jgi:hypothetical protein
VNLSKIDLQRDALIAAGVNDRHIPPALCWLNDLL